ncbi:MAG: ABC transporter ATP-binding protein [Kiritimatiellia bacterium]|jgi:ABC-2 type transport system ATP-binding protein
MQEDNQPATDAEHAEVVVSARGLSRSFRDFWGRLKVQAVHDVSFDIQRGEIFGLLGPNGSGKSTTLKMLLGLLRPNAGELRVFGMPPGHRDVCARLGYLPEENHVYPQLTPEETLDFYGRLFNIDRAERRRRIHQLLEMTGLQHTRKRRVGEFSKGMTRRVGLAQALINDPTLIVLDEPTSGLDPPTCRQVKDLLRMLRQRGKTVILSSHLLADVEDICRRILIMFQGRVIVQGDVRSLLEDPALCRFAVPAPDAATQQQIMDALRQITGNEPEMDRPCRTLEQFFLQKLGEADKIPAAQTAAGRPDGTAVAPAADPAEYLRTGR